jgi:outer membrane biosynthesis protein TonB
MNHSASMQIGFEREKNMKAGAITASVCLLLFLLFFYLQWTLPQIPIPVTGEGIEVNLGNSETGIGDVAPTIPGSPSVKEDDNKTSPATTNPTPSTAKINADENGDEAVNAPDKAKAKPEIKPTTPLKPTPKPTTTATASKPVEPKPKAVYKGGKSTTSSGNESDSYNGVKNQGVAGGKGDQGNPNGNPNSDSYKGNSSSGTAGNGVSIRSGLDGRRITKLPSFEDEFNENAKVAIDITVDQSGNVIAASVNPKGTTTTNQTIRNIALKKAKTLKLSAGSDAEQVGTLVFSFKLRG